MNPDPSTSNEIYPVIILLVSFLAICIVPVVIFIIRHPGKWEDLTGRYPSDKLNQITLIENIFARVGSSFFKRTLHIGAAPEGFYLHPSISFMALSTPVLIPWNDLYINRKVGMFKNRVELRLRTMKHPSIIIPRAYVLEMQETLKSHDIQIENIGLLD
ncbi:MAG: hypothetical protein GY754_29400 [bacterium]|nr:hypothetical protein [bacterium]